MTTLEALSDLYNPGEYGRVRTGQHFTVRDSLAEQLVRQGSARRIVYETKVVTPEVQTLAADPFRHVPVSDAQPSAVAPEGDRVLPSADVPAARTADRGKRPGRSKSGAK